MGCSAYRGMRASVATMWHCASGPASEAPSWSFRSSVKERAAALAAPWNNRGDATRLGRDRSVDGWQRDIPAAVAEAAIVLIALFLAFVAGSRRLGSRPLDSPHPNYHRRCFRRNAGLVDANRFPRLGSRTAARDSSGRWAVAGRREPDSPVGSVPSSRHARSSGSAHCLRGGSRLSSALS
jgi:hypothetical protein